MSFTTLETTNFPLYAVNVLDREHFSIAGGGGAAKTGVPNALVCMSLFSLFCPNIFPFWPTVLSITSLFVIAPSVLSSFSVKMATAFEGNRLSAHVKLH